MIVMAAKPLLARWNYDASRPGVAHSAAIEAPLSRWVKLGEVWPDGARDPFNWAASLCQSVPTADLARRLTHR